MKIYSTEGLLQCADSMWDNRTSVRNFLRDLMQVKNHFEHFLNFM